uniref:Ankyrin repeat protein n=1 Tax=viral metagenome TaxID=1070528 RepID=A0A6C0E6S2_9ZZZZ
MICIRTKYGLEFKILRSGLNYFSDYKKKYKNQACIIQNPHSIFNVNNVSDYTSYLYYSLDINCIYFRVAILLNNIACKIECGPYNYSEIPINKIILSDEYYLFDPKTIIKFNLVISDEYITSACAVGCVGILEWLKKSGLLSKCPDDAVDSASLYGHINVLEWWKNSGLPLKYSSDAMDNASCDGYVNVLEWWKNSGLPLKYSYNALAFASQHHQIDVLEWWKNSGLPLKYDEYVFEDVSECLIMASSTYSYIDVLEWWKNSGLELKYINVIQYNTPMNVIEWWKNSGLPLK